MSKIPMGMRFSATVSIPSMFAPSIFVNGQHDGWDKMNAPCQVIDLTLDFEGDVEVDWEAPADEILESIEDGEWASDYSDAMLGEAIRKACADIFDGDINNLDDDGNGCDGVVLVSLGEEVKVSAVSFPAIGEMSEEVALGLEAVGKTIAEDCAFDTEDGYEGTWFYTSDDEEIHQGTPLDKKNWQ